MNYVHLHVVGRNNIHSVECSKSCVWWIMITATTNSRTPEVVAHCSAVKLQYTVGK